MTKKQWETFFEIHHDLPREGPGSLPSTRIAYSCTRNVPQRPRILDIGCGPGEQTVCLAELSKGEVFAIDNNVAFIEQLKEKVAERSLGNAVHPIIADMTNLPFDKESFDVIWAEGSIFIIGVEAGLKAWQPLLRDGGTIAFTEASWLRDDVPKELRDYWLETYPAIMSIEETMSKIGELGYRFIAQFVLPESDWWDGYYNPIMEKLPSLHERHKADTEALEVVQMMEKEIDIYRRYSKYYGYVFYIAEKETNPPS
jgi:ubiquinone/menaquinone biosynthesis C-methylase UbiE